jgi:hypothetical protein
LPVGFESFATITPERGGCQCALSLDGFFDDDQSSLFKAGELNREIATAQPRTTSKKEEIRPLACGKYGGDGESRRLDLSSRPPFLWRKWYG